MFNIKTTAVVLAVSGLFVYEQVQHSNHTKKMEMQIEELHDSITLLHHAHSLTHQSLMLETTNRLNVIDALKKKVETKVKTNVETASPFPGQLKEQSSRIDALSKGFKDFEGKTESSFAANEKVQTGQFGLMN